MAGNEINVRPAVDEIEVSLFGPGFGECVAVHLGHGDWIIVDSCLDRESGSPVALQYFRQLGVDFSSVKMVVATHYHDDHMAGLAAVFEACKLAKFACSLALNHREWGTLVETYRGYAQPGGAGVDELRKVMQILERRKTAGGIAAPQFAIAGLSIFTRESPAAAKVVALSPSNAAIAMMQERIQQELMPKANSRRRRVPSLKQNDSSVVLSLNVENTSVLLGADLEERGHAGIGWQAIVDDHSGENIFDIFKIPHHGSQNGYHPDQWSKLVKKSPIAALTPYNRGNKLPSSEDCERILKQTEHAYITATPGLGRFRHPERTVHKTMTEATLEIGEENSKQGHLRLRKRFSSDDNWRVELFGDAINLKKLVSK